MQKLLKSTSVVLLGAGRPHQGNIPSSLQRTPDSRLVLDWIVDAFTNLSPKLHFVGGYHIEKIVEKFSNLNYSINPEWQTTNTAESLFSAPLNEHVQHFIAYTDITFSRDVVQKIDRAKGDVILAIDSKWRSRYEGRTKKDIEIAEKLMVANGKALALGSLVTEANATAEFCGLVK